MAIAKSNDDLREVGEDCGRHRVARLTRRKSLRSQTADRRRPGKHGGKPAVASPNLLKRQFDVVEPNKAQVNTITYIRTYEGWMYLAVVLSLAGQCGEAGGDGSLRQGSKYSSSNWRSFFEDEQFGCQYKSPMQLSGQCRGQEFFPASKARTNQAENLFHAARCT